MNGTETQHGFEPLEQPKNPPSERMQKYKDLAKKRITERDAYGRPNEAQMEVVMNMAELTEEERQQIHDEIDAEVEKYRPVNEQKLQDLRAKERQWKDREEQAAETLGPEELAAIEAETAAIQAGRDEINRVPFKPPHKDKHPEQFFSPTQVREGQQAVKKAEEKKKKENFWSKLGKLFRSK